MKISKEITKDNLPRFEALVKDIKKGFDKVTWVKAVQQSVGFKTSGNKQEYMHQALLYFKYHTEEGKVEAKKDPKRGPKKKKEKKSGNTEPTT